MEKWIEKRVGRHNVGCVRVINKINTHHKVLEVIKPVTVYKKVYGKSYIRSCRYIQAKKVIRLIIPVGALIVIHKYENKCRSNIAIFPAYQAKYDYHSEYDHNFIYERGGDVLMASTVKQMLKNYWNVCAPGIHFFFFKSQAKNY